MADEIIGGYKVLNPMQTGQNSQVLEVVETSSHRHFAMKILLPEKASEACAGLRNETFTRGALPVASCQREMVSRIAVSSHPPAALSRSA